jgi:hypothetical protein
MYQMSDTYRDGVQMERCLFCGGAVRGADGAPVVNILVSDVEEIACILKEYVDCPEVWGPTIQRLEQACGRTTEQMQRAAVAKIQAEALPADARTDRSGLLIEEPK